MDIHGMAPKLHTEPHIVHTYIYIYISTPIDLDPEDGTVVFVGFRV